MRWFRMGRDEAAACAAAGPAPDGYRCELESLDERVLLSVTPTDTWTILGPSPDTRFVYVSSSLGHDGNSGLSPLDPVQTLAKAESLIRDNSADWMLLNRGDVWYERLQNWDKSGRSEQERIVIASYGTGDRPMLKSGANSAVYVSPNDTVSNLAIVGLHLAAHTRIPLSGEFIGMEGGNGINWFAGGENLLLEDLYIEHYQNNIVIQVEQGFSNFELRRSTIVDSYNTSSHSQGMYLYNVHGIELTGNLFDHNGWNEHLVDADKTIFNHNVYIQANCTGLEARHNTFSNASSHGIQARSGGHIESNLFVANPLAMSVGYVVGGAVSGGLVPENGVTAQVFGNVILDGNDISGPHPRGFGIEVGNLYDSAIYDNVIANSNSQGSVSQAISIRGDFMSGLRNVQFTGNTIYNWRGAVRVYGSESKLLNVTFTNNTIHALDDDQPLIRLDVLLPKFMIHFTDNQYYSPRSRWFRIENLQLNLAQWRPIMADLSVGVKFDQPESMVSITSMTAIARDQPQRDDSYLLLPPPQEQIKRRFAAAAAAARNSLRPAVVSLRLPTVISDRQPVLKSNNRLVRTPINDQTSWIYRPGHHGQRDGDESSQRRIRVVRLEPLA